MKKLCITFLTNCFVGILITLYLVLPGGQVPPKKTMMQIQRLPLLLFLILSCLYSAAQKKPAGYREYFMEGSYLLLEDEPDLALKNFRMAYQIDSSSGNINYMMGVACLLSTKNKTEAEYYLQKSVSAVSGKYKADDAKEKGAPPLSQFYYGKALHFNYKFDEALKQYAAFKPSIKANDLEYIKMLAHEELAAGTAKNLTNFPLNVKIRNLGDQINSPYPEYSPVLSADERTLIYTTRRPDFSAFRDRDGSNFEDIVVSYKDDQGNWSKPVPLAINTMGHEACINLSADGQILIVYKNEIHEKSADGNGNIYYAEYDGKDWTNLKEFGADVNSIYMETHACLSADGNLLFFSSERPGGYGGKDIYRCVKLPNGKWSKALNMGPRINTEYDEDGGFIHPDGQTFYYASNGPGSMGGYDILYATLNEDNKFSNPTNIGYPINTTDDDIFYVVSPDGKRGYFASFKAEGYGEKDIYEISVEEKREIFLALFKGQILPAPGESMPDNIVIYVRDKETGELIGTYRPRSQNGTFTTILPPGREYTFSYQQNEGEEFYSEDIYVSNEYAYQEYKREVNLEPVKIKGRVKVVENTAKLNVQVLDNQNSKKPVSGARVILTEASAGKQVFTTNEKGITEYAIIGVNKDFLLTADLDDKKSDTLKFSTKGIKSAEKITRIVYLENVKAPKASPDNLLDLIVKHSKTKQGIPSATVRLMDENGLKTEYQTDAAGKVQNIPLIGGSRYKILAYKENFASEEEVVLAAKQTGRQSAVITLNYLPPQLNLATERDSSGKKLITTEQFEFHYVYGQSVIDESADAFKEYLDEVLLRLKERGTITIEIMGSASQVPMRAAGGNPQLALNRANGLQQLIEAAIKKRGVDTKGIQFVLKSAVNGPAYRGDYLVNRKTYEKYQFVRARLY